MSTGFVSVPVVPTFKGLEREFSTKLVEPAQAAGKRAGQSISGGVDSAVKNLERQVKASSTKLEVLDRAHEKAHGKHKVRQLEAEEATKLLARAEEAYKQALADGKNGDAEYKKLSAAKVKDAKATNDLRDAEVEATVAKKKHQDQLDDLNRTLKKHEDAQAKANNEVGKSKGFFGGFRDELARTRSELNETAEGTVTFGDKLRSGLSKIGTGALLGVGAKIGTTVMGGIGTAFSKGFGRLESLEQAQASLEGLGRSADDVEKIMNSVNQSVTGTAFGLDEAAKSAATFSTLGVKSGADMDRVMSLLVDTTAQANSSLDEMSPIMNKIVAAGGLNIETYDQLNERATGVGEALSKHLGIPMEEVREKANEIDFETFAAAMEKNIGGSAQKSGETFGNAFGNMNAALGRLGQKFLEPAFNMGPAVFGAIGGAVDRVGEHLGPVIEDFSERLAPLMEDFATRLGPWLEGTIDSIADGVKNMVEWGRRAIDWMKENRDWLEATAVAAGVLVAVYKAVSFQQMVMAAGGFLQWMGKLTAVIATATKLTEVQAAAQAAWNVVLNASPITRVVTVVAALAAGLIYLFSKTEAGQKVWEAFTAKLGEAWEWATDKIGAGIEWLSAAWDGLTSLFRDGDYTGVLSDMFGLEEDSAVVGFLFNVRDAFIETKETVTAAWEELTVAFQGGDWGYGALAELIGADRAEWVVEKISSIKPAWEELTAAFSGGDWGYGALGELIGMDNAERVIDIVANVKDAWTELTEAFQGGDWGYGSLSAIFGDELGEDIVNMVSSAGDSLRSLWDTLKELGATLIDVGRQIGTEQWETFKVVLESVWTILQSLWDVFVIVAGAVWDLIRALEPILMPILKVIAGIVGGVLVGAFFLLVGAVQVAAEIIEGLASVIQWVAENVLSPLIGLVGDIARMFSEVLAGALSALGDYWSNIFSGISQIWDGWITLLGIGKDFIVATVFGGLGAGLDVLRSSFGTAVEAIGKIWDGLKEIAAAPVRFVVDTVWNNGLLKAVEAITKFIPGLEAPDPVKIGFYRGGILPGFSRMADGDDQLVPMRRGEGVLVSEGLQDRQSRELFLAANEEAKRGKSFAAFMSDFVAGYSQGGIVGSLNSIMREFYPMLQMTSHFRPGDSGYHGRNMAADFSNTGAGMPSTPAMQAAAAFMFGNYGDQLEQLIHHPARNIGSGRDVGDGFSYYGAGTMYGHTDHIHLAALRPLVDPSGVVQMIPFDGEAGGLFNPLAAAKKLWDAVISKISPFKEDGGWFSQVPGAFLAHVGDLMWNFATGKIGSGSYDGAGGISGNVDSWREMAMDAMRRNGFNADDPAQVNAMLRQIQSESGGNPSITQGVIDVNSGGNEAVGILQVIPGTFAAHRDPSLPDDRTDPWANMNAALRYYRSKYGDDLTTMWGHGHGYADGGIVDLFTRDMGGWVPSGALVRNTSGRDELMLPPELSQAMAGFFADYPEAAEMLQVAAEHIDSAAEWLTKAADFTSEEGIVGRQSLRRILDLGIDLPGAAVLAGVLDAEEALWDSRARHLGHLESLAEKEKALEEAREALNKLETSESKLSTQDQRKLDDAQKAVEEAEANLAVADSEDKRTKATYKLADSEEKLRRVREDLDENAEKNAEKHADEIAKANEQVVKAEADLIEAKKQQVMDLDHITLVTQDSILGMIPQVEGLASQIIGMGVPSAAVNQGLSGVIGSLTQVAGMAGPAGITLGMAFDAVKIGIQLVTTVVDVIKDIIDQIRAARMAALQAVADGWRVIADYAGLVVEMQENVASLQQAIVRGLNEQRVAEFQLRIAQQDRLVAEAEGALAVAEARMKLDREIERGNIAAQLRLMGLHEDWDSYLSYQALAANGMLTAWSDSAIGALFTYEAARAKALQAELSARVNQINAEAQLAAATRQNLRNQQDLLKAQERLIRMSAEVAGIDFVEATATAQAADLMVQMAELQQRMDDNWLGRLGIGAWGTEYRGQQTQMRSFEAALEAIFEETGVGLSSSQLDRALDQMKWVSMTDGDPMAVLRQFFPELALAEEALLINDSLGPIWDAQDRLDQMERDAEDFASEIDLFDKVQPLEETIAGLDYTIASLEQAANAWADGKEELRSEYLGAAWANYQAAKALGVDWKFDEQYTTPGVRDQIIKEVTIHLDGREMYTADQVDQLLAEVTSGSNVRVTTNVSASTVTAARRGVMA